MTALVPTISIIAAMDSKTRGIGFVDSSGVGTIPWGVIKTDLQRFYEITTKTKTPSNINVVIMGRNTWESLPSDKKPLKKRINIIVSSTMKDVNDDDVYICKDILEAVKLFEFSPCVENIFIIGGSKIYDASLRLLTIKNIYLTEVNTSSNSNTSLNFNRFFPEIPLMFKLIESEVTDNLKFTRWENVSDPDSQERRYLDLMQRILENGYYKPDRTGTGVISLTGEQLKFDLTNKDGNIILPLLTTKRMFTKGIIEELLMFIRGDVDTTKLSKKGVKIWEGNTSREFLDKNNLQHIEEGSLGKGYSFQWRSWGAKYVSKDTDHKKEYGAIDQLKNVIDLIRKDPWSRRIILSAWNVSDLSEMPLPPCHMDYHFIVVPKKDDKIQLNCVMHQRSGDMFLGVPFNICSTAILTILIAKVTNLQPGEICLNIDDAHIYSNSVEQTKNQLSRIPYKFPKFNLRRGIETLEDMENLVYEDFEILEYFYHPAIKAEMAI